MKLQTIVTWGLILVAAPVAAQDIPSPYESAITDHAQIQLQSTLAKRRLQQAQERNGQQGSTSAIRARAICADKDRVAARMPEAKARQLFALCARAGY